MVSDAGSWTQSILNYSFNYTSLLGLKLISTFFN